MEIKIAVEEYLLASNALSETTQNWYRRMLRVFVQWCEDQHLSLVDLRVMHIRRFVQYVAETPNKRTGGKVSTRSVHHYAQIVKGFINWCEQEDGFEDAVRPGLSKRIEMPKVDEKVIEIFTTEQIKALFKACEHGNTKEMVQRDRAILSVLLDTGIRASELVGLTLDCVHLDPRDSYIKVFGKGRKEREVGLGKDARLALSRYISRYRGIRKGSEKKESKYVFLGRYGEPLTLNGLDQLIDRLGEWAHIKGVRCSPHTFRHHFAISYLSADKDIYKVSRLLGHTNVQVTERYLRAMNEKEVRQNSISVLDRIK